MVDGGRLLGKIRHGLEMSAPGKRLPLHRVYGDEWKNKRMIKEGPFFTLEAAREAAQETANRDNKIQYIVVFKASYYLIDEKPGHEGNTPFYQIEGIVEPEG
jgi:hypothetical protein